MNSKVIEYAYSKIHEYEVEALAYKAKIAELQNIIAQFIRHPIVKHAMYEKKIVINKGGAE